MSFPTVEVWADEKPASVSRTQAAPFQVPSVQPSSWVLIFASIDWASPSICPLLSAGCTSGANDRPPSFDRKVGDCVAVLIDFSTLSDVPAPFCRVMSPPLSSWS
ncbi:hypothetical protein FQZ97_925170 [compost metagenome]